MSLWNEFLVVVSGLEIFIFSKPDAFGTEDPSFITRLTHSEEHSFVHDAAFAIYDSGNLSVSQTHHSETDASLYIFMRRNAAISAFSLTRVPSPTPDPTFKLCSCSTSEDEPAGESSRMLTHFCLGSTSQSIMWTSSHVLDKFLPPRMALTRLLPQTASSVHDQVRRVFGETRIVSTPRMPLLHLQSCLDFDDSRGVLLLGSSNGDLCISYFIDQNYFLPGSLNDDLPEISTPLLARSANVSKFS